MTRTAAFALTVTAVITIAIDQASKLWALKGLDLPNQPNGVEVLAPYFQLQMGWNTGINFGLFGGGTELQRWILVGLAVAVSLGLTIWVLRGGTRFIAIASGLIIGGALGNAWDRVTYGAVADFLNVSCCGIDNPYVFNIADTAIFLGAAALILSPNPAQKA